MLRYCSLFLMEGVYMKLGEKGDVSSGHITILTPGCSFDGKLLCSGTSRIGGILKGEIFSHGLLIIDKEAQIEADITGDVVVIYGQINGTVNARERLEINETAIIQGGVVTPSMTVKAGAIIEGTTSMMQSMPASSKKPDDNKKDRKVVALDSNPVKSEDIAPIKIAN